MYSRKTLFGSICFVRLSAGFSLPLMSSRRQIPLVTSSCMNLTRLAIYASRLIKVASLVIRSENCGLLTSARLVRNNHPGARMAGQPKGAEYSELRLLFPPEAHWSSPEHAERKEGEHAGDGHKHSTHS